MPNVSAPEEMAADETLQVIGQQYKRYAEHKPRSGAKIDVAWLASISELMLRHGYLF